MRTAPRGALGATSPYTLSSKRRESFSASPPPPPRASSDRPAPLRPHPAAFPLAAGSALAAHLAAALAPRAFPEDADIAFALARAPPSGADAASGLPAWPAAGAVLARAVFSIHDLLDAGADVRALDMPLAATPALAAAGGAGGVAPGATVAELKLTVEGFAAVKAIARADAAAGGGGA